MTCRLASKRIWGKPGALALAIGGGLIAAHAVAGVRVIDDAGRTISLAAPAQRIVSLAPHLTEQLFAAGAGGRIVGAGAYSDFPEAARQLQRIGDSAQLDLERIVTLRPDLVVAWRSGNSAAQVERLAALGLTVYQAEAREFADISSTLRRLGQLAGTSATAEPRAERFDAAIAALRQRYAQRREVSVFYQIWHQPLLTINGTHLISQALTLCGARNVFAGLSPLTPAVSAEAVLAADPDAIMTGSVDPQGPDNLDLWRRFEAPRARRLGNLVVVNPDTLHRQSDRVADGVAELCEKLDAVRIRAWRTLKVPG